MLHRGTNEFQRNIILTAAGQGRRKHLNRMCLESRNLKFHRFIISRGCAPGQTRALTVCVLFSAEVVRRGRRQKAMVVLPGWHACRCGESPFGFFHELSPYTQPVGNLFCLPVSLGSRSVFCLHQQRGTSDWVSEWTWTRGVSFLVKFGSRRMKEGNFLALRVFGISQFALTDLARMAHYQWMYTSARPPGTRWGQCL